MNIFKKLLADNLIYEQISAEKICALNNVSLLHFNNNNKYDFMTTDNLKYEVKADHMSNKTGIFFTYNKNTIA